MLRAPRALQACFLAGALLVLLGCGTESKYEGPAPEKAIAENASTPQRIVALAPGNVEILFALGLGDRVVGVGDFTSWPPEAKKLPKLGGLMDANLEALVALNPDLLVALPSEGRLAERAEALGVEVLTVDSDNLADVEAGIEAIARRCAMEKSGRELLAQWRRALEPRMDAESGPRVLISIARPAGPPSDVFTAGPGSFPHELLTRLGAVNVMADAPAPYPTVGLEEVLGRSPEVILELRAEPVTEEIAARLRADWTAFAELPAVRDSRIAIVAGSHTMIPGPRLPQLYREMAAALDLEFPAPP